MVNYKLADKWNPHIYSQVIENRFAYLPKWVVRIWWNHNSVFKCILFWLISFGRVSTLSVFIIIHCLLVLLHGHHSLHTNLSKINMFKTHEEDCHNKQRLRDSLIIIGSIVNQISFANKELDRPNCNDRDCYFARYACICSWTTYVACTCIRFRFCNINEINADYLFPYMPITIALHQDELWSKIDNTRAVKRLRPIHYLQFYEQVYNTVIWQ